MSDPYSNTSPENNLKVLSAYTNPPYSNCFYINPNYSISHLVYQLYLTLTSHIGCGEICIDFL